jgi:hypothetical protein
LNDSSPSRIIDADWKGYRYEKGKNRGGKFARVCMVMRSMEIEVHSVLIALLAPIRLGFSGVYGVCVWYSPMTKKMQNNEVMPLWSTVELS